MLGEIMLRDARGGMEGRIIRGSSGEEGLFDLDFEGRRGVLCEERGRGCGHTV